LGPKNAPQKNGFFPEIEENPSPQPVLGSKKVKKTVFFGWAFGSRFFPFSTRFFKKTRFPYKKSRFLSTFGRFWVKNMRAIGALLDEMTFF